MLKFFQVGFSQLLSQNPMTKWVLEKKNATKDEKNACTVFLYIEDIKKKMSTLERILEGLRAKLSDLTQMVESLMKSKTQKVSNLEQKIKDVIQKASTFSSVDAVIEELKNIMKPGEQKPGRGYSIRILGDTVPKVIETPETPEKAYNFPIPSIAKSSKSPKSSKAANFFAAVMGLPPVPKRKESENSVPKEPPQKSISPKANIKSIQTEVLSLTPNPQEIQNLRDSELEKYKPLFELEAEPNELRPGSPLRKAGYPPPANSGSGKEENDSPSNGLDRSEKSQDTISSIQSPKLPAEPPKNLSQFLCTTETERIAQLHQTHTGHLHSYSSGFKTDSVPRGHNKAPTRQASGFQPKVREKILPKQWGQTKAVREKSRSKDPLQKKHNLFKSSAPKIESSPYNESPKNSEKLKIIKRLSTNESQTPKKVHSPNSGNVIKLKKILTKNVIEPKPVQPQLVPEKHHISKSLSMHVSEKQKITIGGSPKEAPIERLVFPQSPQMVQVIPRSNQEATTPKRAPNPELKDNRSPRVVVSRDELRLPNQVETQHTLNPLPRRASRTSTMKAGIGQRSSGHLGDPHGSNQGQDPDESFEVPQSSGGSSDSSSQETEKLERKQTLNKRASALANNRGQRSMTFIPTSPQKEN